MVGALIYLTTGTRPDISEAVSVLASYSQNPKKVHKRAVERLIKYLYNTREFRLSYGIGTDDHLYATSDASHNTAKDGKSRTGFLVHYAGSPISWKSKRQTVVATSTRDAEYMYVAASICSRDIIYAREFLCEINTLMSSKKPNMPPTPLLCDCQPAIDTITKDGFSEKSKSIRLSYHVIRDIYQRNEITPIKIAGTDNPADLLTKPLSREQTLKFCNQIFRI